MGRLSNRWVLNLAVTALSAAGPLSANQTSLQTSSYEEAFLVRRIAEFFKDGDYALVKAQIQDFFHKYPKSPLKDHLNGVLGDLYLEENQYEQALASYEAIEDRDIKLSTLLNKLQCCYELSLYDKIIDNGLTLMSSDLNALGERKNEFTFLMAESLYRQALDESNLSEKRNLASMASSFYEELLEGAYSDVSLFALAEIYTIMNENEQAAKTYAQLAEDHPEMKAELLFRAATSLAAYDPKAAIKAYDHIIKLDDQFTKEAKFNQLILYFSQGDFEKVIEAYPKIERIIPEDQTLTFQYILGKSYYALHDHEKALPALKSFLESQSGDVAQNKNALLISMSCSYEMKDLPFFSKCLGQYKELFPNDAELPKALFMHAMLSKESGHKENALHELETLMQEYRHFDQREGLLFEYAYAAYDNHLWKLCRDNAQSYLREFPYSDREGAAWKLFLASSLELFKDEENQISQAYSKENLFADLAKVMDKESILTPEEKLEYELLYAKMAYELGYYPKGLVILDSYVKEAPEEHLADAHFLMGLCQVELGTQSHQAIAHFEKVLELAPEFPDRDLVHLHLFNGYIALSDMCNSSEISDQALDQAAEHLYVAMESGQHQIKAENQLWLADHYFQKGKFFRENDELLSEEDRALLSDLTERSATLYEKIFYPIGQDRLITLTRDTLYLEPEALKYAELLGLKNANAKKINLLIDLVQQQDNHADWEWGFQRSALFELAKSYEATQDLERALETYTFISERERSVSSPIINIAAYHSAKLRFMLLEEGQKTENNEEIHEILTQLKELQIRKNAESEPIHLEAALEYAQVRALVTKAENRDQRYLFFLNRIIEDFNSNSDLIGKNYQQSLGADKEKQELFSAYMNYIEAEKLRLAAKEKLASNENLEAEELNEQALSILFEIENSEVGKDYLHARVMKSIEAISEAESY